MVWLIRKDKYTKHLHMEAPQCDFLIEGVSCFCLRSNYTRTGLSRV